MDSMLPTQRGSRPGAALGAFRSGGWIFSTMPFFGQSLSRGRAYGCGWLCRHRRVWRGAAHDHRNEKGTADLDQFAVRHDRVAALGERVEHEEHRRCCRWRSRLLRRSGRAECRCARRAGRCRNHIAKRWCDARLRPPLLRPSSALTSPTALIGVHKRSLIYWT